MMSRPSPSSHRRKHTYIPQGHPHVVPYLIVRRVPQFIGFLKVAFGAVEEMRTDLRDGTVTHAQLRIKDAVVMVCEARSDWPAMPTGMYLYVRNCETAFDRAIAAGATALTPPTDSPDGKCRTASVQDPSGNLWFLTTHRPEPAPQPTTPTPATAPGVVKAFTAVRSPAYSAERRPR